MGYIMACQADTMCVVEAEEHEAEEERSLDKLWGLKVGLAFSFLVITVIASYIPAIFKGMESYSVCLVARSTCTNLSEFSQHPSAAIRALTPIIHRQLVAQTGISTQRPQIHHRV